MNKTERINLRISPEVKAKAEQLAAQAGCTLSKYIIHLLEEQMDTLEERPVHLSRDTGHESGIVVYPSGAVIAANWTECEEGQLPMVLMGVDLIPWPMPDAGPLRYVRELEDVRQALPDSIHIDEDGEVQTGMDIAWASYDDLAWLADSSTADDLSGRLYELADGTQVIVPEGWA